VVKTAHIVLIGLMASGKTTVGTALGHRLHRPFVDNDQALVARYGHSAREIETTTGFDVLHRDEAEVLCAALADPVPAVIAAAAGAVPEPGVEDALGAHIVVYLHASPAELARRVSLMHDDGHRPFGSQAPEDLLREQYATRDAVYRSLATLVVDTESRSLDQVIDVIARSAAR